MKIKAESTDKIVTLNGIPARIWEAETENGVKCDLFVTRVGVLEGQEAQDLAQFEKELKECKAPREDIKEFPLRLIL